MAISWGTAWRCNHKAALVRAVVTYQMDALLELQEPLLGRLDSMEALRAWRDLLIDFTHRHGCQGGCPVGSLASELAETDAAARLTLVAEFERWEAPIRAGLHAMRDQGDLRPEADPDPLALAILAALQGGFLLTQVRRDIAPLQAALDSILDRVQSLRR